MFNEQGERSKLSRRNLLKAVPFVFANLFLPSRKNLPAFFGDSLAGRNKVDSEENSGFQEIEGVEVYGLDRPIADISELEKYWSAINNSLEGKIAKESLALDPTTQEIPKTIDEKREFLLGPDRKLTAVITQSAWQRFKETGLGKEGAGFIDWIRNHVDLLNREFKTADPSLSPKAGLGRVFVVADDLLPNKILNQGLDSDGIFFFNKDYEPLSSSYLFKVKKKNSGLAADFGGDRQYYLEPAEDSLTGKEKGVFDQGLVHEFMHVLFNLPDEYIFNCQSIVGPFRFKEFSYNEGSLNKSPSPSIFLRERLRYLSQKKRGENDGGVFGAFLGELPDEIIISVRKRKPLSSGGNTNWPEAELSGEEAAGLKMCSLMPDPNKLKSENYFWNAYCTDRMIGKGPVPLSADNWQRLSAPVELKNDSHSYTVHSPAYVVQFEGGGELIIPTLVFNISRWLGIEKPSYTIGIIGFDFGDKFKQVVGFVKKEELETFVWENRYRENYPYAVMEVEGTDYWLVWFLE